MRARGLKQENQMTNTNETQQVRRVVCSAIRAEDGTVLLGVRHYSPDMLEQIEARRDGEKFKNRSGKDQGFVDQFGVFMTREEAYIVADESGQIWGWPCEIPNARLYSEMLY